MFEIFYFTEDLFQLKVKIEKNDEKMHLLIEPASCGIVLSNIFVDYKD